MLLSFRQFCDELVYNKIHFLIYKGRQTPLSTTIFIFCLSANIALTFVCVERSLYCKLISTEIHWKSYSLLRNAMEGKNIIRFESASEYKWTMHCKNMVHFFTHRPTTHRSIQSKNKIINANVNILKYYFIWYDCFGDLLRTERKYCLQFYRNFCNSLISLEIKIRLFNIIRY